ncbi:D-glycero-D-manno-heptose 1,7-bisphosphate phosphatase [Natronocella acetinitrilica]|uniref:D,D-heptose 1,7-bisphosphate phosphatase n=1 Tax=Natronocella acetinitrilica TaxID=414046 RepID=A0AAE3G0M5_9GAMM|nr:D-glycero-D-manno-heptose 1,7-bisphosphate phosphatase [Natronocella acetinitrilica]
MPAIILDRDGVINEDSSEFIKSVDEWRAIPGSLEAIAALSQAGWTIAICTNQSGIARGLLTPENLEQIHDAIRQGVQKLGGNVHGIYSCPHGPLDGCACRKPKPGLYIQAAEELGFTLRNTPVVGDAARDLEAAIKVDARPILVRTGKGVETAATISNLGSIEIHDDLQAVASALLA